MANTTATPNQSQPDPGSYAVAHIRIYPHNNPNFPKTSAEYVEIKNIVIQVVISESIYQSSVVTELHIVDSTSLVETFRLGGGEKVELSIFTSPPKATPKVSFSKPAIPFLSS